MRYEKISFGQFSDEGVLNWSEAELPSPQPGQVVVAVAGAGVNPIDYKTRRGMGFVAEQIENRLPWTPGYDISGTLIAVGEGADPWQVGDKVIGMPGFPVFGGGYATHVVAEAQKLVAAPEALPLAESAGIPLAALTAWQALFDVGRLVAGQKILIHAAAGGVGHFAVQFAKVANAYVVATASPGNHDFLREIGADEVIDYRTSEWMEDCYGLDLVLDGVGGQVGLDSLALLAVKGKLVTVPTVTADQIVAAANQQGAVASGMKVQFDAGQLEEIVALVNAGEVQVRVSHRFPLREAALAHRQQETGHTQGKIILVC